MTTIERHAGRGTPVAPAGEIVATPGRVLAALACPACAVRGLTPEPGPEAGRPWPSTGALRCARGHTFGIHQGVPDFVGEDHGWRITPFQRVMQFSPVVSVYERWWRPAGFWVASRWSVDEAIAAVMEMAAPARRELALDVGCGPGLYTRALWKWGARNVVGVDLATQMLGRAVTEVRGPGISFVRASAMALPFADESVDAICCAGALHLFDDPDRALREFGRVLAPGGVLVGQTVVRPGAGAGRAAAAILDRYVRFGFFEDPRDVGRRIEAAGLAPAGGQTRGIAHLFRAAKATKTRA